MTPREVLNIPMQPNDAEAATVGEYLVRLAEEIWRHEEGFSGKRPFGNSGWQSEVHTALAAHGAVQATRDIDGFWEPHDYDAADKLVLEAINAIYALLKS